MDLVTQLVILNVSILIFSGLILLGLRRIGLLDEDIKKINAQVSNPEDSETANVEIRCTDEVEESLSEIRKKILNVRKRIIVYTVCLILVPPIAAFQITPAKVIAYFEDISSSTVCTLKFVEEQNNELLVDITGVKLFVYADSLDPDKKYIIPIDKNAKGTVIDLFKKLPLITFINPDSYDREHNIYRNSRILFFFKYDLKVYDVTQSQELLDIGQ